MHSYFIGESRALDWNHFRQGTGAWLTGVEALKTKFLDVLSAIVPAGWMHLYFIGESRESGIRSAGQHFGCGG